MQTARNIFASLVLGSLLILSAESAVTRFTVVNISPTSWVARGLSGYSISPDMGWAFSILTSPLNTVYFRLDGPPLEGTEIDSWDVDFSAPNWGLLTPGFYADAQRDTTGSDRPGLGFSNTDRGDNEAGGFFEILEARFNPDGTVEAFSANFTHFGEADPNNWAVVELRFNAIPEPACSALLISSVCVFASFRRRTMTPSRPHRT
jgi:hypothetical protein